MTQSLHDQLKDWQAITVHRQTVYSNELVASKSPNPKGITVLQLASFDYAHVTVRVGFFGDFRAVTSISFLNTSRTTPLKTN